MILTAWRTPPVQAEDALGIEKLDWPFQAGSVKENEFEVFSAKLKVLSSHGFCILD